MKEAPQEGKKQATPKRESSQQWDQGQRKTPTQPTSGKSGPAGKHETWKGGKKYGEPPK